MDRAYRINNARAASTIRNPALLKTSTFPTMDTKNTFANMYVKLAITSHANINKKKDMNEKLSLICRRCQNYDLSSDYTFLTYVRFSREFRFFEGLAPNSSLWTNYKKEFGK